MAIQDADLEYDPAELQEMSYSIEKGVADVVYGSRFLVKRSGSLFLSLLSKQIYHILQ